MMKKVRGITIECVIGDIATQEGFDGVVCAANPELRPGGGVAGAIHEAAGPELYTLCKPFGPLAVGDAVVTGAGKLPNRFVIHALGPIYEKDPDPADKLANAYRSSLKLAEDCRMKKIAFPSLSTGVYGYPLEEAADVAFCTIHELLPELISVKHIRFVLYNDKSLKVHEEVLERVFKDNE